MAWHSGDMRDVVTAHLAHSFCFKGSTQFKIHSSPPELTSCQQPANEEQPTLQVIESLRLCKSIIILRTLILQLEKIPSASFHRRAALASLLRHLS